MEIEFYHSSNGTLNVKKYISDLPNKTKAKFVKRLELIQKNGLSFVNHSGTMKKLKGYNLYEIKIDFNKICYRILCVIKSSTCWLLHVFEKKSNNTPLKEIRIALTRARDLDLQLAY